MDSAIGSRAFATAAGKDFYGNDLANSPLSATTPAQCAALCTSTEGCNAFTYNPYVQRKHLPAHCVTSEQELTVAEAVLCVTCYKPSGTPWEWVW